MIGSDGSIAINQAFCLPSLEFCPLENHFGDGKSFVMKFNSWWNQLIIYLCSRRRRKRRSWRERITSEVIFHPGVQRLSVSELTWVPVTNTDSQDPHQTSDSRVRGQRWSGKSKNLHFKKVSSGDSYALGGWYSMRMIFYSSLRQNLDPET